MAQYLLLIDDRVESRPTEAEWIAFFELANESGYFRGGSEIADGELIGRVRESKLSETIGGYMRFDSDDREALLQLLERHPIVIHGGTVELCELVES